MREHLIALTASAETAAVAGFATVRGMWMPLVEEGDAVHLGTASSLHALMQTLGALAVPQLMLHLGFTGTIRLFLFLHALVLMLCAIISGSSLLSFYVCHAGAGFLSCTVDFLQQWGLLLSSTPEQQLTDFNLFQRSFLFGPVLGAGISSVYLSSVHLWKQDVTRNLTSIGPDVTTIKVLFALLSLLVVCGGLVLFLVPLPSERVAVRSYTYEDLMDALLQGNEESHCAQEAPEGPDDASQRRISLLSGVPNLNVDEPPRRLVREETGVPPPRANKHKRREKKTADDKQICTVEESKRPLESKGFHEECSPKEPSRKKPKPHKTSPDDKSQEVPVEAAASSWEQEPCASAFPPSPRVNTNGTHSNTSENVRWTEEPAGCAAAPCGTLRAVKEATVEFELKLSNGRRVERWLWPLERRSFSPRKRITATLAASGEMSPKNGKGDLEAQITLEAQRSNRTNVSSSCASPKSSASPGGRSTLKQDSGEPYRRASLNTECPMPPEAMGIEDPQNGGLRVPQSSEATCTSPELLAQSHTTLPKTEKKSARKRSSERHSTVEIPYDLRRTTLEGSRLDNAMTENAGRTQECKGGSHADGRMVALQSSCMCREDFGSMGQPFAERTGRDPFDNFDFCLSLHTCAGKPVASEAAGEDIKDKDARVPDSDAKGRSGSVNFDYFATYFSPTPSCHQSFEKMSKCRGAPGVGKPKLTLSLPSPHRNKKDSCSTTYFRRNGPSLLTNLTVTRYGGLKQAPLDFKVHDEKRRERAENCDGAVSLRLFYYGVGANANIIMTSRKVIEIMAALHIKRNVVSIPQLEFLPLKSYNKQMLTDAALRDSVAVVRGSLAHNKLPQEVTLYTKSLRIWPLFFPIAVFHSLAFGSTLITYIPINEFGASPALSVHIFLGSCIVTLIPVLLSKLLFPWSRVGHLIFYVCGLLLEAGAALCMGLVREFEAFIPCALIGFAGLGMLCPAGVKASTKMVPSYLQLQQLNCQLWPTHIVRIVSPLLLGALYQWTWAAPFITSTILRKIISSRPLPYKTDESSIHQLQHLITVLVATSTTMLLRPQAWGLTESAPSNSNQCGTSSPSAHSQVFFGYPSVRCEKRRNSVTSSNSIGTATESEVGEWKEGSPAGSAARVHQAIRDLTNIGEKPAVLPGLIEEDNEEMADVRVSGGLAPVVKKISKAAREMHSAVSAT